MAKGSGGGGGRIPAGATTAALRSAANMNAASGNYRRAIGLLSAAIRRYPAGPGQLRERDIAQMRETVRIWRGG